MCSTIALSPAKAMFYLYFRFFTSADRIKHAKDTLTQEVEKMASLRRTTTEAAAATEPAESVQCMNTPSSSQAAAEIAA